MSHHSDLNVVAVCATSRSTLMAIQSARPDVAVVELSTSVDGELDLLEQLASLGIKIVIVANGITDDALAAAMRLGVSGLAVNGQALAIADCVREVADGRLCLDQHAMRSALARFAERDATRREVAATLTAREIEITRLIAAQLSNKEISTRLFVSEGTVKVHLHNIFEKLFVRSRKELADYARKKGFV